MKSKLSQALARVVGWLLLQLSAFSVRPYFSRWASVGLILLGFLIFPGCSAFTVIPTHTGSSASFDGNARNSGFLGYNPDGSGTITPAARDRYNTLVGLYENMFTPHLVADFGITPIAGSTNFNISAEAIVDFIRMNQWRRDGH